MTQPSAWSDKKLSAQVRVLGGGEEKKEKVGSLNQVII
jgi:hypothetical protein